MKKIKNKDPRSKLWFVFPDIHIPEHDEQALATALKAHEMLHPDYSLFLGDVLDCGIFSSHSKRTIGESLAQDFKKTEVDPTRELLDLVQKNTQIHTHYLCGNHEERIERWAANNGQVALSLYSMLDPCDFLARGRKKFSIIPYSVPSGDRMGYVQIAPDLVAVHGWSFARHAARIHLDKSRSQSIVFGHTHRAQSETSRDPWTGKVIKAFNPGTLSKLQPLYAVGGAPNDWSHGFAIIYVGRRSWTEYCISIVNGCCVLPDGTEVKV
jgi:predicted phosphodiesterase